MKKYISIAILISVWCFTAYIFLWEVTISPMLTLYKLHGAIGSIIYFGVEVLVLAAVSGLLWLVAWASDNLFK